MSEIIKWKYYTASCFYRITKEPGLFGGQEEGVWILLLNKEFYLTDGLNYMGDLGYELVGIQATDLRNGGEVMGWFKPSYFYIFKKPLEASASNKSDIEKS